MVRADSSRSLAETREEDAREAREGVITRRNDKSE
jgi:hypothetical protein